MPQRRVAARMYTVRARTVCISAAAGIACMVYMLRSISLCTHRSTFSGAFLVCGIQQRVLRIADLAIHSHEYEGHWILGDLAAASRSDDGTLLGNQFLATSADAPALYATTQQLLHVVPRTPTLIGMVRRTGSAAPPMGSVYIDRPPEGSLVEIPISCLTTRVEATRSRTLDAWTIEIVTLFLDSPHFGRAWQTVVGRNGGGFVPKGFDSKLSALYLKLSPSRRLLAEAWFNQSHPTYVTIQSKRQAHPNTWYSIVARSDGRVFDLFVNSWLEGSALVSTERQQGNGLAVPPDAYDGAFTVGCGMFDGKISDSCSCLISEVRISEQAMPTSDWLWTNSSEGISSLGSSSYRIPALNVV